MNDNDKDVEFCFKSKTEAWSKKTVVFVILELLEIRQCKREYGFTNLYTFICYIEIYTHVN